MRLFEALIMIINFSDHCRDMDTESPEPTQAWADLKQHRFGTHGRPHHR